MTIEIYHSRWTPGITPDKIAIAAGEHCRIIRPGHRDNNAAVTVVTGQLMTHAESNGKLVREYTFDDDSTQHVYASDADLIYPLNMLGELT